jgi:hypothetical protein
MVILSGPNGVSQVSRRGTNVTLGWSEEFLSGKIGGPFQWRNRHVCPHTLKVRLAIGCSWRQVFCRVLRSRGGSCGLAGSWSRHRGNCRNDQRHRNCQNGSRGCISIPLRIAHRNPPDFDVDSAAHRKPPRSFSINSAGPTLLIKMRSSPLSANSKTVIFHKLHSCFAWRTEILRIHKQKYGSVNSEILFAQGSRRSILN